MLVLAWNFTSIVGGHNPDEVDVRRKTCDLKSTTTLGRPCLPVFAFPDSCFIVSRMAPTRLSIRSCCHVAGLAVELVDAGKISGRRS